MPTTGDHRRDDQRALQRAKAMEVSRSARVRLQCVLYAEAHGVRVAAMHFGFHRSTVSKWVKQYVPGYPETLEERSRAPHAVRRPETDPNVVEHIQALRRENPAINRAGIHSELCRVFDAVLVPSESTIGRILKRLGLTIRDAHATGEMPSSQGSWMGGLATALIVGIALSFTLGARDASAAGSASFQLYDTFSNDATQITKTSDSYKLHEDALTWYKVPLVSANYQLRSPLAGATAAGTSGGGGTTGGGTTGGGGTSGGGTRGGGRSRGGHGPGRGTAGPGSHAKLGAKNAGGTAKTGPAAKPGTKPSTPAHGVAQKPAGPQFSTPANSKGLKTAPPRPSRRTAKTGKLGMNGIAPQKTAAPTSVLRAASSTMPVKSQTLPAFVGVAGALGYAGAERSRRRGKMWAFALSRLGLGLVGTSAVASTELVLIRESTLQASITAIGDACAPLQFFGAVSDSCAPAAFVEWTWMLLVPALCAGSILGYRLLLPRFPKRRTWLPHTFIMLVAAVIAEAALHGTPVSATTIGPTTHVYNGRLLNASGNAIVTAHAVRFSEWKSEDYQTGDVDTSGNIITSSPRYAGWQEVHTVTPDSNGYFSVELGSITAMPALSSFSVSDLADLFLQVEVKSSTAANTSYEFLDVNSTSSTVDRSPILSVPFSLNADRIDQRDVGTGSGSIPVLLSGGLLPIPAVPGGTNRDSFVIDNNNSATDEIALQFGGTLAKKLTYDIINSRFNFNASVRIEGSLTVTGLVNNVDLSQISAAGSGNYLRASSGGGLNLNIGQGDYRLNGNVTHFAGTSALVLPDNATSNVYFTSTGITVTSGGFPTNKSYIPVAQVTTAGSGIASIADKRVLSSDNREQTLEKVFAPSFEHASFQGDASNNVGQLSMSHDNTNNHNFYLWTSTKTSLQDYDVFVRVPLSSDFVRWSGTPLSVSYRSTSGDSAMNALTIQVYDTNGQPVTLGGSTSGLANTSWTTTDITFSGNPTWTAGQEMLVKFTMQAKDSYQIQIGKMRLQYVDLLDE